MSLIYRHDGKVATFDDAQTIVLQAVIDDWLKMTSEWVMTDIAKEELEEKLKEKEIELQELQAIVDASISNLDPDKS